ncbi:MAG: helix-turn-helix transcriptional regulator [Chitinispirillaceae bacterium]|nr:helix-turn-helix transcriptional regulator [Chitinispirillaceae bacterium]
MRHLDDLGYKIRILRQQRGLSQAALGQRLNISQKEISHYENNYRRPPAEILSGIARVLETSIAELYGEPVKPNTGTALKKSTIWLIAEKLELIDETERCRVLSYLERMIAEKKDA